MKYRTNSQRVERKARKVKEAKAYKGIQLHINYHVKKGYHEIVAAVKEKISHIVVRNAHPGRKIKKKVKYT
jgi:hypothetical protein